MHDAGLLITGSSQGIGLAIALAAARSGARAIVLCGRDARRGADARSQVEALGAAAHFIAADLSDPGAPDSLFASALECIGRIDGLVNAAARTDRGSVAAASADFFDRMVTVNLRAPFLLMQHTINHLRSRKVPGSIVNILSMNAHGGLPELGVYSATKGGLAVLTKNAAHAHRFDRIRMNGINVGWVDTPAEQIMQAETLGKGSGWLAAASARQPFGRLLSPDDVARLALFLLSEQSEPMTGALIDQEQWVIGAYD